MSLVFAGDVMLDGGPGHLVAHGGDPFAEFSESLSGADLAVCNLECVLAPGGKQVLKPYTFRGAAAALPLVKRYFTAVSVANNHTGDFGPDAFARQLTMLQQAGLGVFGGGRNAAESRRPWIVERHGMRVALLGYNDFPPRAFAATGRGPGTAWLTEKDVIEDIQAARRQHRADVVVPFLHWGEELEAAPTPSQRLLARRLIEAGASAVIGGHPHVTQTVDVHRGKPIVYSLGNFVFDYYPGDPAVWTGWLVKLTFHRDGPVDLETTSFEIDKAGIPRRRPPQP